MSHSKSATGMSVAKLMLLVGNFLEEDLCLLGLVLGEGLFQQ